MDEMTLEGSCLCGNVRYRSSGTVANFFHCHCQRCRKATGTGHASNIILAPGKLEFLSGEDRIRVYKVPDARFFANVFCQDCGGRVPVFSEERGVVLIPAGSLDEDVALQPTGRIFRDSAVSWSCGGDDIPAWDSYPPRG